MVQAVWRMLAVSGFLRLRDCKQRNRSAQDDRFVGMRAGSRFLAALGMTERRAKANATTEAGSSLRSE